MTQEYTPKAIVQRPAPDFTADVVVNQDFKTVQLSKLRGKFFNACHFFVSLMSYGNRQVGPSDLVSSGFHLRLPKFAIISYI